MLKDKEFDELIQPIVNIYNKIEMELLLDVAERFSSYSSISGSLEWYLDKLDEMKVLNDNAIKIFAKYSKRSEIEIRKMLTIAQYGNFIEDDINRAYDMKLSKLNYEDLISSKVFKDTLNESFKELDKTFKLIQTKALESQKKAYMDILNKAYIDVSSGTYSYDTSIRNAIKAMAKKGITGVTYKRKDGTIVNYSIEAAVRRDTLSATHSLSNKTTLQAIEATGNNYVDISKHIGARIHPTNPIANHAGWQGKQYQLNGESQEYPNFVKSTGYGDILGFGGVNCRHRMFNFFPGISVPVSHNFNDEENETYYNNTQYLRKLERQIRLLKKQANCLDVIGQSQEVKSIKNKIRMKSKEIDDFCDKNNLRRDYSREQVI